MTTIYSDASIVRLLLWSGPANIARFVVTVISDAVERVSRRWSFPNVIQERLKGFDPLWPYGYPASSPSWEVLTGDIEAPVFHALPRSVFLSWIYASCDIAGLVVRSEPVAGHLAREATARARVPALQMVSGNYSSLPAVASAPEERVLIGSHVVDFFENDKTPKRESDHRRPALRRVDHRGALAAAVAAVSLWRDSALRALASIGHTARLYPAGWANRVAAQIEALA